MTASTVSSALVTNRRASPPTYNDYAKAGQNKVSIISGTLEVATTSIDEVGDVIILADVRPTDRVMAINLACDDLDTHATATLAFDVGLYKNVTAAGTGATVVDADAYASAVLHDSFIKTIATGAFSHDCAFEARDITKIGQDVMTDGGETSANDLRQIGLTVTATAATAAAGTLSFRIMIVHE